MRINPSKARIMVMMFLNITFAVAINPKTLTLTANITNIATMIHTIPEAMKPVLNGYIPPRLFIIDMDFFGTYHVFCLEQYPETKQNQW